MTESERPPSAIGKAMLLLLALLPPARMAWIVFTNGENNLSDDYYFRIPLVAAMLDGTCSLGTFVREAWIGGGHSTLALIPIYYLNARFLAWDVRVELVLGLLIVGATLALIAAVLPARPRWLLLPLLSLLLFSTTKVTSFTFGESALQMGLAQLGVAIGAFGLARWPERPIPLAVVLALGGILSSWSWGGGIMTWLVFATALFLFRVRSPWAWVIFLSGAAVGIAQYVWLLFFSAPNPTALKVVPSLKIWAILDLLGQPFVNGIARAEPDLWWRVAGAGGLLALAAMLTVFRMKLRARPAPLLLVAWGLLVALEIALFRAGVAPWYASPITLFWAGLVMLLADTPAPIRAVGVFIVALLTLRVQSTWEDKSFYLPSRAPVSATCLREWRTAPAACHSRVFQWGDEGRLSELALLGDALERHRLSVFGPHRTYLLQGDFAMGRVTVDASNASTFLSRDGRTPGDPNDFYRLDLVLAPGAAVTWPVDLPPNLTSARFLTRVRAAAGDPQLGRGARVSVAAEGSAVILEERAFLPRETARTLSVDLSSLAGRRCKLRLAAEETHEGETPLVFEAPKIELHVGE